MIIVSRARVVEHHMGFCSSKETTKGSKVICYIATLTQGSVGYCAEDLLSGKGGSRFEEEGCFCLRPNSRICLQSVAKLIAHESHGGNLTAIW